MATTRQRFSVAVLIACWLLSAAGLAHAQQAACAHCLLMISPPGARWIGMDRGPWWVCNRCLSDDQAPPKPDAPPRPDCAEWAANIREQYRRAKLTLEEGREMRDEQWINSAKRKMLSLEHRWRVLKRQCPDIGELEPGVGGEGPPDWNEKQDYRDRAREYRQSARVMERRVNENPGDILLGGGSGPGYEFIENGSWAGRTDYMSAMADLYDQMADDPPSRDYHNVLLPAALKLTAPADAPQIVQLALAAREAQHDHLAYLRTHLATFERLQGAQAAHHGPAMARQSTAMAHYATAALEKGRVAEQKWQAFLAVAVAARQKAMAEMKKDPKGAEKLAAWQESVKKNGLGDDVKKQMSQAGLSEARIKAFEKAAPDITIKEMEESLANQVGEVRFNKAMHDALAKAKSKSPWPEPDDATALMATVFFSHRIYESTKATAVELEIKPANGKVQGWWLVPVGAPLVLRPDQALEGGKPSGPVAAGKYDVWVAVTAGDMGKVFPAVRRVSRAVEVAEGKAVKVRVDLDKLKAANAVKAATTAELSLKLKLAEGEEPPAEWLVVEHEGDSMAVVARQNGVAAMKVPPGKYDVYLVHSERAVHVAAPAARGVEAVEGKSTEVALDSGIAVETSAAVGKKEKTGWWAVSLPGRGIDQRLRTIDADRAALPPGKYDVFWLQSTTHKPVRVATDVEVKAGQWSTVKIDSAVTVKWPVKAPTVEKKGGLVAVVSGTASSNRAASARGRADGTLVLPPGKYDVYWWTENENASKLIKAGVEVKAGAVAEVDAK